jgi:acyl carrier protein
MKGDRQMNRIDETVKRVKELIIEKFKLEITVEEIKDDIMIINGGLYLDSAAVIVLIVELEKEFGIMIDDEDVIFGKDNNIIALAEYIVSKLR